MGYPVEELSDDVSVYSHTHTHTHTHTHIHTHTRMHAHIHIHVLIEVSGLCQEITFEGGDEFDMQEVVRIESSLDESLHLCV